MARGDQIQRQWLLLQSLQARGAGAPLRELASELDVTERTIQRDFEMLQELGFPIDFEENEHGKRFWRMPHDFFRTGPLVLSLTEAISLHLARDFLAPLSGTLFADGLQSLLTKIHNLLPEPAMDHFRDLDRTVHVRRIGQTNYAEHAGTIALLTEAARERRTVEIRYRSVWRPDEYLTRYDMYGLVYFDGDLFAVGRSHRAAAVRVFKITRIADAALTNDSFAVPASFSLEQHFRSSFGIVRSSGAPVEVVVKFTGPATALVEERVWHDSQRLEWLPAEHTLFQDSDDEPEALIATFRLSNLVELKRWLKGFGEHAEVLRPSSLRREMADELLAAARKHQS